MILGSLRLMIKQVLAVGATGITLASLSSPYLKRGNRVQGTLSSRGVQHLQDTNPSPRREIEMRFSVLKRTVLSVAVLTIDTAYRALISALVAVRVSTLLRTANRKEVRLDVMLSLGIIHRMQPLSCLLRGIASTL